MKKNKREYLELNEFEREMFAKDFIKTSFDAFDILRVKDGGLSEMRLRKGSSKKLLIPALIMSYTAPKGVTYAAFGKSWRIGTASSRSG